MLLIRAKPLGIDTLNIQYTAGTTISVKNVELTSPPMTTVASSAPMMPLSVWLKASGNSANVVVNAVMRIGRRRTPAALDYSVIDIVAALAQLLHECEKYDCVGHHDAHQQQEAH